MKTFLILLAAAPFIISGIKNLEPVQGDGTIPNGASIVHKAYEHLTVENVNSVAQKVLNPIGLLPDFIPQQEDTQAFYDEDYTPYD